MDNQLVFQGIAADVQLFRDIAEKERFVFVVGALVTRLISLRKAAEVMDIETDALLKVLDLMGLDFSYLGDEDIEIEKGFYA